MRRTMLLAALAVQFAALGARAETCTLQQMASLDMTILPNGTFTVPVSVNGTPLNFLVNTARAFSGITGDAATRLGLKISSPEKTMYGVGGDLKVQSAAVDSFMVGRNEAKNFHLQVFGAKPASHSDGALSLDMLDLFDVELDFAAKKMNLFSQDHCPGKVVYWTTGGYAQVAFKQPEHIRFDMALDGQTVSTALNTGSDTTWIRHKVAVRDFSFDDNAPGVERVPDSTDAIAVFRKRFGLLQIGGVAVQNPMIEIVSDHIEDAFRMDHSEKSRDDPIYGVQLSVENLTLGMNVIGKLHLYIANKEHKIYATAADAH